MDIREFNRHAWDREVKKGKPWTHPVPSDVIAKPLRGDWSVLLTENISAPKGWFPPMDSLKVLGMTWGGDQQSPVLSAASSMQDLFSQAFMKIIAMASL